MTQTAIETSELANKERFIDVFYPDIWYLICDFDNDNVLNLLYHLKDYDSIVFILTNSQLVTKLLQRQCTRIGVNSLFSIQKLFDNSHEFIIGGSLILQMLLSTVWYDSDVDIYTREICTVNHPVTERHTHGRGSYTTQSFVTTMVCDTCQDCKYNSVLFGMLECTINPYKCFYKSPDLNNEVRGVLTYQDKIQEIYINQRFTDLSEFIRDRVDFSSYKLLLR